MEPCQSQLTTADAPPPYSAIGYSRAPATTESILNLIKPELVDQFCRFILEILAFTFDADFTQLNHALGRSPATHVQSTSSLLSQSEHDTLLHLSRLTTILRKDITWQFRTLDCERRLPNTDHEMLAAMIVRPAIYLRVDVAYMLRLINTYAAHRCDPAKRSTSTLVSQEKPYLYGFFRLFTFLGELNLFLLMFSETLHHHLRAIKAIAPSAEIRVLLYGAMKRYEIEELGLEAVFSSGELGYHSHHWQHMGVFLVPEEEERRIKEAGEADKRREQREIDVQDEVELFSRRIDERVAQMRQQRIS